MTGHYDIFGTQDDCESLSVRGGCTKHNYLVKRLEDLPRIVHEAFYVAASGRPGPVLVDITKDVLQGRGHYQPVTAIHLPGYKVFTEGHAGQIRRAAQMIQDPKGRWSMRAAGLSPRARPRNCASLWSGPMRRR